MIGLPTRLLREANQVTSRGRITIPIEICASLGINEHSYLEVSKLDREIRLSKLRPRPLSSGDPIWQLIGCAASGDGHVADEHDRHLADGEIARWRKPS